MGPVNVDARELAAHGRGNRKWEEMVRVARTNPGYSVVSIILLGAIIFATSEVLLLLLLLIDY